MVDGFLTGGILVVTYFGYILCYIRVIPTNESMIPSDYHILSLKSGFLQLLGTPDSTEGVLVYT